VVSGYKSQRYDENTGENYRDENLLYKGMPCGLSSIGNMVSKNLSGLL
jgi:hypothetical protein